MEFQETMRTLKRLCNTYHERCEDCPLHSKRCDWIRNFLETDYVCRKLEDIEKIAMQWAEKHPIKTNRDKFKEVFGFGIYVIPTGRESGHLHIDSIVTDDAARKWLDDEYQENEE